MKLTIPLDTKEIDIHLDSCLPRIIELANNSTDKKLRFAACELLHSLITYMIGKSAYPEKKANESSQNES